MIIENEIKGLNDFFFAEHEGEAYQYLVESLEKPLLKRVLDLTGGNQIKASRILGINRNTLRTKLKHYGMK